jgi:hypothetical protein
MSNGKIFDWKGNELKAGMTIYFIQTSPGFLEGSRHGIMYPDVNGKAHQTWEPEEQWQERKNKKVWRLGDEYLVHQDKADGTLFIKSIIKGKGDLDGYIFSEKVLLNSKFHFLQPPTIAIKGISDTPPENHNQ